MPSASKVPPSCYDNTGEKQLKKIEMKTTNIKIALLLVFGLQVIPVKAQDMIKALTYTAAGPSIVRELSTGNVMICHRDSYSFHFTLVDNNSSTAHAISVGNKIKVKDFQQNGDSIYFCGVQYKSNGDSVGVFGFFKLTGFPNTTIIRYFVENETKDLFRIKPELHQQGQFGAMHIVLLGTDTNYYGAVVDAVLSSNQATSYIVNTGDTSIHVDDMVSNSASLTVVYNKVSTNVTGGYANVLVFAYPNFPTTNIFTVSSKKASLFTQAVSSRVRLSKLSSSNMVAVYDLSSSQQMGKYMYLTTFTTQSHGSTVRLTNVLPGSRYSVEDLNYNKSVRNLDVLSARSAISLIPGDQQIYHFGDTVLASGGVVCAHKYPSQVLHSVYEKSWSNFFYATGHDTIPGTLNLINYKYNGVPTCGNLVSSTAETVEKVMLYRNDPLPHYNTNILPINTARSEIEYTDVIVICRE